ncbi:CLK4-associating serine/arginine rich protein [Triplophysa tibetana]|uniref:CLK4-associating serine/arginine rich protein n=1 Tax=Triplophysa tibetana TaxID=1572043 RepID=A0A5A9P1F7_9TELE|nr:CLK4-associating serine/arginine rich protein [Triplophysa tibetana]
MWQEARKHERKLRGMMVDYKRRGERRREYYEKIKKDPAQFLQVHGRAYKIHLDSAVALAAESPINMMPWQGDTNNMIDRFDVRAHLDYIPTYTPPLLNTTTPEQESEERKCNYERYRGLVQNDFASISEEQCLYQIYVDELYGGLSKPNEDEKKKLGEKKAQIGYTYEDSTVTEPDANAEKEDEDDSENSESEEDEVIPDIDVEVDVDELNPEQVTDINKMATTYGMAEGDFVGMLRKDKEEVEAIKHAKALEAEKAMYSGRRSRRQRREFREKYMKGRQISPPSYARRDSPTYDPYKRPQSDSSSESHSRSRSPGNDKITFITSFGGSDEEGAAPTQALPVAASSHTSSNTAGHSRGSRRRRSSSSHSSYSSRSSSRRSSRSSSHSRRSRRSRGGRDRDSRYSRSRSPSRRRSESRSRHRSGGGSSRRRYDRTRSRSTDRDKGRDRIRERDRDRDRGRRYTARRRTRSRSRSQSDDRNQRRSRSSAYRRGGSVSQSPSRSPAASRSSSLSSRCALPASAPADKLKKSEPPGGKETGAAKPKMTPQEKLKIRMQKALNKQSKADKRAAQAKIQQQESKRQEREGVLRAMARKIRIKERERREKERDEWEKQYGRQSHSPSPNTKYSEFLIECDRRSRSRSRSPHHRY